MVISFACLPLKRKGRRLTRNQGMHSVNRDELLGQRVGNPLVVNTRAWNATYGLTGL